MANNSIYQIKGDFFHFACLSSRQQANLEVSGIEIPFDVLEDGDICAFCGDNFEEMATNGGIELPEPEEKDDDV